MANRLFAREVLNSINLGSEQGTQDPQDYFIESTAWVDLVNDEADLILGRKGSGKTKLYRQLLSVNRTKTRNFSNQTKEFPTRVVPLISSQLDDDFKEMLAVAGDDEELMKTGWLMQIGGLACVHLLKPRIQNGNGSSTDLISLNNFRHLLDDNNWKKFFEFHETELKANLWQVVLKKLSGIKSMRALPAVKIGPDGVTIEPSIYSTESEDEARSLRLSAIEMVRSLNEVLLEREVRIWVVIDSLDELLYGIRDVHANAAVRSLLRAIVDIRTISQEANTDNLVGLRLKVFARDDVIERMTISAPFPGFTAIPQARISWTNREIGQMISDRLLSSPLAREFYSAIQVQNEPERFVSQVFTGELARNFVAEITRELSDAWSSPSPRNVIGCLKRALDISRNEGHLGDKYQAMTPLVNQSNIDKAKNQTSVARLDDTIKAEYPNLIPLIDRLSHAPHTYANSELMAKQLELTSDELDEMLWWSELAGLTTKNGRQIQVGRVYRPALYSTTSASTQR